METDKDNIISSIDIDDYINEKIYDLYPLGALRKNKITSTTLDYLAPLTIAHVQSRPGQPRATNLKYY